MRILVVSHPPLAAELGSAQIAVHLAAALTARGHLAMAWSPEPLSPGVRWWNLRARQRRAIERFAREAGPFDVIDVPPISASRELARLGFLVARDVQPELLYLRDLVADQLRRPFSSPGTLVHALHALMAAGEIVASWRRARLILCLGSGERAWMGRHFPGWAAKLGCYWSAPSAADRAALLKVRQRRATMAGREGTRFLWIGRWSSHKGTERLMRWIAERAAGHPADRFTLAGCGERAAADWQSGDRRELVASGRVTLRPAFSRLELPVMLAAHDAGIFTSKVEGWGLCLSEMLESGLPVYATEAGAVPDLRPLFPHDLRPFPPPAGPTSPAGDDLAASGYLERCAWEAIALSYEQQVLAALAAPDSGSGAVAQPSPRGTSGL